MRIDPFDDPIDCAGRRHGLWLIACTVCFLLGLAIGVWSQWGIAR